MFDPGISLLMTTFNPSLILDHIARTRLDSLQTSLREILKPKDRCPYCGCKMDVITWGRMGDRYMCNSLMCKSARHTVEAKYVQETR